MYHFPLRLVDFSGKSLLFEDDIYFDFSIFSSLTCTVGILTSSIYLFFSLRDAFTVINFPLSIASAAYHRFRYVTKHLCFACFRFVCFNSNFPLWFLFLLTECLTVGCLISMYLWIFQFSFCCWFLVSFHCVYKRNFAWLQSFQTY